MKVMGIEIVKVNFGWNICFRINVCKMRNIEKTSFVIFHPPQRKITYQMNLRISNNLIKQDRKVKYLGLIIDSNLNWKSHLHELQSQPKVSGHPQKKALPRFPSFNVATMMSTFLSIFF